jgi:SAM-dependent methyltransferase
MTTTSQNNGTVEEMDYIYGFYRELSPSMLNLALVFHGVCPLPLDQPFSYYELGCGQGFCTNLIAAANPHAVFFANDANATHVENARKLAASAGLDNVTFHHNTFDELAALELPQFDFIVMHGVYSWVDRKNRQVIVDFIRSNLKPGGVVYVSYNCMPGWADIAPLRWLMNYAAAESGPPGERIAGAIGFAKELDRLQAGYFAGNPAARRRLTELAGRPLNYVAGEYFNSNWTAFYHAELVHELAEAGLSFAGSAQPAEWFDDFLFSDDTRAFLDAISDRTKHGVAADFLLNRQFRKDVFIKGRESLSTDERRAVLFEIPFALAVPPRELVREKQFPAGRKEITPQVLQAISSALLEGPATIPQLLERAGHILDAPEDFRQGMVFLLATGQVVPAVSASAQTSAAASARRFNKAVVKMDPFGSQLQAFASPVTGTGVEIADPLERLFIASIDEPHKEPALFVWELISGHGGQLSRDGVQLQGAEENLVELRGRQATFGQELLPMFRHLFPILPKERQ